jgi:hypothetical protein
MSSCLATRDSLSDHMQRVADGHQACRARQIQKALDQVGVEKQEGSLGLTRRRGRYVAIEGRGRGEMMSGVERTRAGRSARSPWRTRKSVRPESLADSSHETTRFSVPRLAGV